MTLHDDTAARYPWHGLLLALTAVAIWGSTAVIARHLALEGISMPAVAFLRVVIGGTLLGLWLAARRGGSHSEPAVRSLLSNRWVWLAMLCYGGNMLVYHLALRSTSAAVVSMLQNTSPVVALVAGALFFGERVTGRSLLSLALALGGAVLVCLADPGLSAATAGGASVRGNLLGVLSGVTWGGFTVACRGQGRTDDAPQDGLASMTVMLLGSALLLLPLVWRSGGWPHTPAQWGWVAILATLHTALATVLWRAALTRIGAYTASLLFLLTIVLTMVFAALFLHERVTLLMAAGGTVIVTALLLLAGPTPPTRTDQSSR